MEKASSTVWHASTSRVPANATIVHNNLHPEQMLDRLTAIMVREPIQDKIDEFQVTLGEMFQKITVLLHCTKVIDISGSPTIVDEHTIVDAANHLIQKCEPIIKYLDFMKEKTGLPSGGDPSLESEVMAAREWANILINAFKALKKVERAAGGLQGIKPNHCVLLDDGRVMVRNQDGEWTEACHTHPLMRIPGTQWHKWFGLNMKTTHTADMAQIPNEPRVTLTILRPRSAHFINKHFRTQFRRYDEAFNQTNRKIAFRGLRESDVTALYSMELETCIDPEPYDTIAVETFYLEENNVCHRPQATASGHIPFEEFNFTLNNENLRGRFIYRPFFNAYLRGRVPNHVLLYLSEPDANTTELDPDVPRGQVQEPIFFYGSGAARRVQVDSPRSEDSYQTVEEVLDFFPLHDAAPGIDGDEEQDDELMDEDYWLMDEESEQDYEPMEDGQHDETLDGLGDGNYGI